MNKPATDLQQDDFRVFDDGRQVPITAFGKIRRSLDWRQAIPSESVPSAAHSG